VRGLRIAGATGIVAALSAIAFLAAAWLGDERATVSAVPGGSQPIQADGGLASGVRAERIAIESTAHRESISVAAKASGASDAEHTCPDVDVLVHELAAVLEDCSLMTSGYLNVWLPGQANDLDAHCVPILESFAQDAQRRPAEQMACLLLLFECAWTLPVTDLTPGQRSMLWQAYDVQLPSPVLPSDCEADGVTQHRSEIAIVAGMCLARLGDRSDLAQLVERLGSTPGTHPGLAAMSLSRANSFEVAELLLARMSDPSLPTGQMVRAMAGLANRPDDLQSHPELLARAAQALADRWTDEAADSTEIASIDSLLATLDPELRASCWAKALDRGTVGRNLNLALEALLKHAASSDIQRVAGLLTRGADQERLVAVQAVLGVEDDSSPSMSLRNSAYVALAELGRTSESRVVRREALLAARKAPDMLADMALHALDDEDVTVREAAAVALAALPQMDPQTRARLELAAASDTDKRVRRAAEQGLR